MKKENRTERIVSLVTPSEKKDIITEATNERRTMSDYVIWLHDEHMKRKGK